jgi:hypothetical protein
MLADKIAIYRSEIGNIPSNVDLHKLPFFLWTQLICMDTQYMKWANSHAT